MILGIDIGGSTTDIVGFKDNGIEGYLNVEASDPLTSASGALGKFINYKDLDIGDIEHIAITGVGSSYVKKDLFQIETRRVKEFQAIGAGGAYLTSLDRVIIVSMGTGTAIVYNDRGDITHLGGTGVGGGTLVGLGDAICGTDNYKRLVELAEDGDLSRVDLSVGDITLENINGLNEEITASNFGNLDSEAAPEDYALGIINLVYQTVGMLAVFAARIQGINDVVVTGKLAQMTAGQKVFKRLKKTKLSPVDFHFPDLAEYSTAIGAAISSQK